MFLNERQQVLVCGWEDVLPAFKSQLSFKSVEWIHLRDPDRLVSKSPIVVFREGEEESIANGGRNYRAEKILKLNTRLDGEVVITRIYRTISEMVKEEKKERAKVTEHDISSRFNLLDL